jgi:hypothetical protein
MSKAKGHGETDGWEPHGFLIRIADTEARRRAIMALGWVREPYCGFTDFRFLVTNAHIEALEKEAIPFELLS